ncbi:MAG: diacylglycerol kinase family protein [Bacilli bacterium]|nr:diacylglycerol kinase family protein [Bacilli bacterium]
MKQKLIDNKKLINSFKYAFNGIKLCIQNEQNMIIHFTVATLVIVCAVFFKISKIEWIICLLLIGLVLMMELLNTAIENICDLVTKKENDYVKIAKDTAAGSVLVMSVISAIIGLMIFVPKLIEMVVK